VGNGFIGFSLSPKSPRNHLKVDFSMSC